MAWITERNLSKATSFYSLIEFLWESSLRPDAQEAFLAEEGHLLPHVNGGHSKLDSFQPQNHEEPLAKGTVAHILTVMSSLKKGRESSILSLSAETYILFQLMKQWPYLVHSLHDKQVILVEGGVSQRL